MVESANPPPSHSLLSGYGNAPPYVVAVSGASGAILARETIDWLRGHGYPVYVTASRAAREVWRDELGEPLEAALYRWQADPRLRYFEPDNLRAPMASGSFPTRGMIVIPCSMATVAAIAHGSSSNLLQRAADCHLKEGRRLVLAPRETPLSAIHLENLLRLANLGVRIVPPVPAFYTHPRSLADLIQQMVGRALVALGVPDALDARYVYTSPGESPGEGSDE
ncbi:MAG: UbiX family flavin prenyltransferase [Chloroflexi bacterium]|nr:UbiX family flavin prenyltransferase [Chloroflexota bacterium]